MSFDACSAGRHTGWRQQLLMGSTGLSIDRAGHIVTIVGPGIRADNGRHGNYRDREPSLGPASIAADFER